MSKTMSLDAFLSAALSHVESASIRAWAQTAHNAPIVRQMAKSALEKKTEPMRFATYLVCVAMGF